MASVQTEDGLCRVTLWDGTLIDGPEIGLSDELKAFCEDLSFLIESPTFFEMKYDPGSFTDALMLWLESELEPAVNCVAKRSKAQFSIAINSCQDDHSLTLLVDKQNDKQQDPGQTHSPDDNEQMEEE